MEQGAQRNDRYAEGVEGQDAVRSRRWGVGGGLALEPQPTRRSGERRGVWRRSGRKKPGHKRTWSIFILTEHFLDGINQLCSLRRSGNRCQKDEMARSEDMIL